MSPINPSIFKAYDIRGIYPDQLDGETARQIGQAFVQYLGCKNVVVGQDMRLSSPVLFEHLTRGITDAGSDVIDIGLCSTDALYFTVGKYAYEAGIMITASHNPKEYNGFKMCRQEAVPLSGQEGIEQIKQIILKGDFQAVNKKGAIYRRDITEAFIQHLFSFIDVKKIKPFKIVADAGNGMAGMLAPKLFKHLPCRLIPLFFELDGSFPNHPASPIEPENMAPLQKKVLQEKADLGVAFDGDADRMFIVDEKGKVLGGDIVTALVAKNLLQKDKGAAILYNLICSRTVPQVVQANGGKPVRTRVGHALIKPLMKSYNAIFGGEHSGHFYFRENYFADSAFIALMVCLELFSQENKPVSELVKAIDPYFRSGEINSRVEDIPAKIKELEKVFSDGKIDFLDGITVEYPDWWFNVRPSNTEPLLRLNVEADSLELLEEKTSQALRIIRS
ncbi:MAG: phosphomannomutase/phosphoglucomutase [candidate division Zixibacteria bacterium RBG_16_48_11]|nr:MAG: phosphomannomutase/phosphoglucomutase [candidate division Zixibacteria bacterium RBG_16_48_11]